MAASTALPQFSPAASQYSQLLSPGVESIQQLGDLLMPAGVQNTPTFSTLPAELQNFLAQRGFSSQTAVPSPFVLSNKSMTTSHGVTENGDTFTQQHYTVNTHEWYTPMMLMKEAGDEPPLRAVTSQFQNEKPRFSTEKPSSEAPNLAEIKSALEALYAKAYAEQVARAQAQDPEAAQPPQAQNPSVFRSSEVEAKPSLLPQTRAQDSEARNEATSRPSFPTFATYSVDPLAQGQAHAQLSQQVQAAQQLRSQTHAQPHQHAQAVQRPAEVKPVDFQYSSPSPPSFEAPQNEKPTDGAPSTRRTALMRSMFEKAPPTPTIVPGVAKKEQQQNGSGGGAARVWRPEITANTEMSKFQDTTHSVPPFKVSLEHNNSSVPPKGFNQAAYPFNTDPRVKHLQYNSPMGLYSNSAAAEQYAQQTQGIVQHDSSVANARDQPAYLRSETLKVLKEQENGHGSQRNTHGLPVCYVCTKPILGLMAQAAGHQLHADCLACATCGSSLKNIGHHFIDGKFYCDIHQRLKRATSTGPSDPNLMARTPPTAAQPTRPVEPARGNYQPDLGINRRPLSVSPNPNQWSTSQQSLNVSVGTPRTQGVISPSNRGVPSSQMYGAELAGRGGSAGRATQELTVPDEHVPASLRAAVSPRRRARLPREWPPTKAQVKTTPYWNTELHQAADVEPPRTGGATVSLQDAVQAMDDHPEAEPPARPSPRRLLIVERSPSAASARPPISGSTRQRPSSVQLEPVAGGSFKPVTSSAAEPDKAGFRPVKHDPVASSTFQGTNRLADFPPQPILKTDAITSPRQDPDESSEPSSLSEPAAHLAVHVTQTTQTSPGLVATETKPEEVAKPEAKKKLQKKPGRKDPRRLTAIYNPNAPVDEVEKPKQRSQTVTVELDPRRTSQPEVVQAPRVDTNLASKPSIQSITSPRPFKPYQPEKLVEKPPSPKIGPVKAVGSDLWAPEAQKRQQGTQKAETAFKAQQQQQGSQKAEASSQVQSQQRNQSVQRAEAASQASQVQKRQQGVQLNAAAAQVSQAQAQQHLQGVQQAPHGFIGINITSRPFKAPEPADFPSHQKRFSSSGSFDTPEARPSDLGGLPPLMKGKQVITPQGSPFATLTRRTTNHRTPSPVLNISIEPIPPKPAGQAGPAGHPSQASTLPRSFKGAGEAEAQTLSRNYKGVGEVDAQILTRHRQSPVMGLQSLGKRTPSPSLKKLIQQDSRQLEMSPMRLSRQGSLQEPNYGDWAKVSEVVDESDIMTDTSRRSDESANAAASELSDVVVEQQRLPERLLNQYDVDESELVKIRRSQKKDVEDTDITDIDSEDEKERWMREELELARKEELMAQMLDWERNVKPKSNSQDSTARHSQPVLRSTPNSASQSYSRNSVPTADITTNWEGTLRKQGAPEGHVQPGLRSTPNSGKSTAFSRNSRQDPEISTNWEGTFRRPTAPEQTHSPIIKPNVGRQQLRAVQPESIDENTNWDEKSERDTVSMMSESDEWRRQAMQLLDDEGQMDRDMMIVSQLHEQLEECRGMDDADRKRAIHCMKRHQKTLGDQRLHGLLDSAISFVSQMDTKQRKVAEHQGGPGSTPYPPQRKNFGNVQEHPANPLTTSAEEREILEELGRLDMALDGVPEPPVRAGGPIIPEIDYPMDSPVAPRRNYQTLPIKTEQLSHVLDELHSIMRPRSSDFIVRKLEARQREEQEEQQQAAPNSFANRSAQQTTTTRTESHTLNQPVQGGKVPYCEACRQQIRGAFVLAQGLSWCPEHFICANTSCGRRLLECGFVEENGQKFCENCFESNIAPRCAKCTRPIVSDCLNALQKKWHPQCFTCAHCSKPFGNSAFYLEQGSPYCENDWNRLFTTKCYQCTYPIEAGDRWVEALGHAYHSNCFNCTRCNVNLEGESFYAKNGEPFCKLHA
ncbi:unnamed protein product, partial [Mesorhabditis spiculigera]